MANTTLPNYQKNTADTTAELCLFYNLAFDRIQDLLFSYEQKKIEIESFNTFTGEQLCQQHFSKQTYLCLKVYLWKEPVSRRYTQIKQHDICMVNTILQKLVHLRNFHSHYYHDASVLQFPHDLVSFIALQLQTVKQKLAAKQPECAGYYGELEKDIKEYGPPDGEKKQDVYKHFYFFDGNGYIQPEGKNFFLSFFLVKGEMQRFLKKRKRCKRDNGERYQVKNKLYTELCHRDASNRFFTRGKEDYCEGNEPLRRQFNTILNYLLSKPVADKSYMPPPLPGELFSKDEMLQMKEQRSDEPGGETVYIRRSSKFVDIAVRFFMDMPLLGYKNVEPIDWEVRNFTHTKIEKQLSARISTDDNKTYMEAKDGWHRTYRAGNFPRVVNNHIRFVLDGCSTPFIINVRELKNWLYFLLAGNADAYSKCIALIKEYGQQYAHATGELCKTHSLDCSRYPLVFHDGTVESAKLSDAHIKLLTQEPFCTDTYRQKILARIHTTLDFLKETKRKKTELSRNRKNRVIMKCLNWYLPQQAKLKPDEVNLLSIYNFTADNEGLKNESRDSIIQPLMHKLHKATEGAFNCIQASNSLDDLFDTMLDKKRQSLQQLLPKIAQLPLPELHLLAAKLHVRMPGADTARNGNDRLQELQSTLSSNPVLLPNGFFKRNLAPDENYQVSTLVRKRAVWTNILPRDNYHLGEQDSFVNGEHSPAPIRRAVLDAVETHFDELHRAYVLSATELKQQASAQGKQAPKTFKLFVESFAQKLPGTDAKELRPAVDLYKKLKETEVQDALLAQILFKYHNLDLPLRERELKTCKIAELHRHEYTIQLDYNVSIPYKQLDDLATHWDRKKLVALFKNNKYWNWHLRAELQNKGIDTDMRMINYVLNSLYEDSFRYIQLVLAVEKKILEGTGRDALNQLIAGTAGSGRARIEFGSLLDTTAMKGKAKKKFVRLRNSAFHTFVPDNNLQYCEEKERLATHFGIRLEQKKGKGFYRK